MQSVNYANLITIFLFTFKSRQGVRPAAVKSQKWSEQQCDLTQNTKEQTATEGKNKNLTKIVKLNYSKSEETETTLWFEPHFVISIKIAKATLRPSNDVTAETARKSFGDPLVRFLVKFAQSLTASASYSAHFIRNLPREVSVGFLGSFDMKLLLGLKPRPFKFLP